MPNTLYVRIKKEYATAIIKGLQKLGAIELLQEPVAEWQKKAVHKRLKDLQKNPSKAVSWNEATKKLSNWLNENHFKTVAGILTGHSLKIVPW